MSGYSDSTNCLRCGGVYTLMTYSDVEPHPSESGKCIECGLSYYTAEEQLTLDKVNEIRLTYELAPLDKLKDPIGRR